MSLSVCSSVAEFRSACERIRRGGERLGLVPTMGALHAGHLSLIGRAKERAERVAVTIFVNPTQFGPNEDLSRYPRDLDGDIARCREAGADLVFAPPVEQMYPPGEHTRVRVGALGEALCGRTRPGHFEGVATVVSKLFNVAGSCVAVFGRKDYQQLKVVERMARDLLFDVEVLPAPTVRDRDGVALSSRNAYLGAGERTAARAIPRALSSIIERHRAGERRVVALLDPARAELERAGLRLDYVELADADEIEPFEPHARIGERALAAIAAYAGSTRLIDNVVLGEDDAPLATRDTSSTE